MSTRCDSEIQPCVCGLGKWHNGKHVCECGYAWETWEAEESFKERFARLSPPAIDPEVFKSIMSLFMCDDPVDKTEKILDPHDDEMMRMWLNARSIEYGYDDWVVAFHEIGLDK